MKVEIWSDVVCPWCYIGKRRFEAALADFAHRDEVEVEWKAFELDPSASSAAPDDRPGADDYAVRLAAKYGSSQEQAQAMIDSMTATAAEEGLDLHFERAVRANTLDAHQVIHLAGQRGGPALQDAVKERLLLAYFTQGEAVGDHEVLVRLAAEAGLDAEQVRAVLADASLAEVVRAEEADAAALGVRGVPFFVVDRRYGVSGAQPAEQLLGVLERAWAESRPLTLVGGGAADTGDGGACGPDGCRV